MASVIQIVGNSGHFEVDKPNSDEEYEIWLDLTDIGSTISVSFDQTNENKFGLSILKPVLPEEDDGEPEVLVWTPEKDVDIKGSLLSCVLSDNIATVYIKREDESLFSFEFKHNFNDSLEVKVLEGNSKIREWKYSYEEMTIGG